MADAKSVRAAKKIELTGIVQGVGFRPFVYRLAKKYCLSGNVKNISGNVEIFACGETEMINSFLYELLQDPPAHAVIEDVCITDIPYFDESGFKIEDSSAELSGLRFFSPDIAVCARCRNEVFDSHDRRHKHYFNTCVSCGPRFSVLSSFPYDRENTSMNCFDMCLDCNNEYTDPSNRRFHAETIACNSCGPVLLYSKDDCRLTGDNAFRKAVDDIKAGNVVCIKGIGGYHFACLPHSSAALSLLREQKGREYKPFAIMFKDISEIKKFCEVSDSEKELLASPAYPIVLLRIKNNPFAKEALCGSNRCGCFLPYTPLHELIMAEIPCLVMTSANKSDSPIIKDERSIFSFGNAVLYNDREIVRSVEDSVAQIVCYDKTQIIRRARGYVPLALEFENIYERNILAMGGDLKAAFSIASGKYVTMSQYFGDLENADVMKCYKHGIDDFIRLFDAAPKQIVCDTHPRYFSAQAAKLLANRLDVPLIRVSHHHAHIASVIAEHHLAGAVIGVAFDGSGYGDDGNIWGGEFLVCENEGYRRLGHFEYTPLLGSDNAAKDAQKTAACYLYNNGISSGHTSQEMIAAALKHNVNTFLYSGIGRLFDALAAISGVCRYNNYEGQCATALQYRAENAYESGIDPVPLSFSCKDIGGIITVSHDDIIRRAYYDSKSRHFSPDAFALGFHIALANAVLDVCRIISKKENITQIALSGGVFQNSLLLSLCVNNLEQNGFSVYYNSAVPANDGGLALGQAYIAAKVR